jgi:hypothetical protein
MIDVCGEWRLCVEKTVLPLGSRAPSAKPGSSSPLSPKESDDAASPKLSEDEARRLVGRIFGELRRRSMERHKITATPEEIQQFVAAIRRPSPEGQDDSEEKKEEATRGLEAIGEQMVKGWKLDRALYQKYGGTVIFQ